MKWIIARASLPVLLFGQTLVAACSPNSPAPSSTSSEGQASEFSAADKAAARALSIGDERSLQNLDNSGERALACADAIEMLGVRLRETGGMTETQLSALDQARMFYARQVPPGLREASETRKDNEDTVAIEPQERADPAQQARIALACLRKLQNG